MVGLGFLLPLKVMVKNAKRRVLIYLLIPLADL
jgi:hypothetical protein